MIEEAVESCPTRAIACKRRAEPLGYAIPFCATLVPSGARFTAAMGMNSGK